MGDVISILPEIKCSTKEVDAYVWFESSDKYFNSGDIVAKGEKLTPKASPYSRSDIKYDLDNPIFSCGSTYLAGSGSVTLNYKEFEKKEIKITLSADEGEKSFDLSGLFLNITQAMPDGTMFEQTAPIDGNNTCTVKLQLYSLAHRDKPN